MLAFLAPASWSLRDLISAGVRTWVAYSVTNAMGKTMVCTPLSKYEVKLNLLFRYCVNVLIELNEMVQVVNSQYFGRALPERRINVIFA